LANVNVNDGVAVVKLIVSELVDFGSRPGEGVEYG
jgi:hypothetical protein